MNEHPSISSAPDSPEYRNLIRKRLKKQQAFNRYLGVWAGVSLLLLTIWFFTMPGGHFWPMWPILGMGIGAFFQWRDAYGPIVKKEITEADIDAEIQRLKEQSKSRPAPFPARLSLRGMFFTKTHNGVTPVDSGSPKEYHSYRPLMQSREIAKDNQSMRTIQPIICHGRFAAPCAHPVGWWRFFCAWSSPCTNDKS